MQLCSNNLELVSSFLCHTSYIYKKKINSKEKGTKKLCDRRFKQGEVPIDIDSLKLVSRFLIMWNLGIPFVMICRNKSGSKYQITLKFFSINSLFLFHSIFQVDLNFNLKHNKGKVCNLISQ